MIVQEFDTASLEQLLSAPEEFRHRNIAFLPGSNSVDLVLAEMIAEPSLTTTAFVIPFLPNGNAVFAQHARRLRLEIPGGHIEPGETMVLAATRECKEETGFKVTNLVPIGFQRITCEGQKPEGYKYPFPHSFQQFFAGIATEREPSQANEKIALPVEVTLVRALDRRGPLTRIQINLFSAGFCKLFETGLIRPSLDTILALAKVRMRFWLNRRSRRCSS